MEYTIAISAKGNMKTAKVEKLQEDFIDLCRLK